MLRLGGFVAKTIGFAFTLALAPTIATAQQATIQNPAVPPGRWKQMACNVVHTDKAPKIDGVLDDACWKDALHAPAFYRFNGKDPIKEQTEAWICADKTHLYIAFHCLDSHPELIRANETQREGDLNHDDQVLIAIDSQSTKRNGSQFTVSARGTQLTQLEGGTAENLTWAGDWHAATHRNPDGWSAEIDIPFALLRYPKGAKSIGIALVRQLARETNPEVWPYIPPEGFSNALAYICNLCGMDLPSFPPRLIALPYVLGSIGQPNSVHAGLDVKYPLSTTLTGLGTLFPDFQSVEGAVQDLSFSYTQKYLPDRRPFFVEGNQFFQDSFLFYSQQIPKVDEGLRIVGKQGPTTIAALATNTAQDGGQTSVFTDVTQDLGLYSQVGAAVVANYAGGRPGNEVARLNGQYGYSHAGRQVTLSANATGSMVTGQASDISDYVQLSTNAGNHSIQGSAYFTEVGPNFTNQLGFVPEKDLRGTGFYINRYDNNDKGKVENSSFNINANTYRHMTGGFFHDSLGANAYVGMRSGWGFNAGADASKYEPYVDNTISAGVSWNQKTLFHQGGISCQVGRRQDQSYHFLSLGQGFLVAKPFSLQLNFGLVDLGGNQSTQTILTGTYRLNSQETFGGRLVQQDGDVNLYLSYGRRMRHGTDLFLLIGDPNSRHTKPSLTLKVVRPF